MPVQALFPPLMFPLSTENVPCVFRRSVIIGQWASAGREQEDWRSKEAVDTKKCIEPLENKASDGKYIELAMKSPLVIMALVCAAWAAPALPQGRQPDQPQVVQITEEQRAALIKFMNSSDKPYRTAEDGDQPKPIRINEPRARDDRPRRTPTTRRRNSVEARERISTNAEAFRHKVKPVGVNRCKVTCRPPRVTCTDCRSELTTPGESLLLDPNLLAPAWTYRAILEGEGILHLYSAKI
ncbi:hypothetical protein AAG570_005782 [Ranatra chinensis]|uniref:Uncharacterized protein n=1 Tax=Ranatra chinensis TaxID=642074 RepID=A0ABD0XYF9_9HEMI